MKLLKMICEKVSKKDFQKIKKNLDEFRLFVQRKYNDESQQILNELI
jgi:hypothetical protein